MIPAGMFAALMGQSAGLTTDETAEFQRRIANESVLAHSITFMWIVEDIKSKRQSLTPFERST